ncbi:MULTISPECIES: accessory gene regulator ArgB-like protein [unclassified Paenibacillus]|uniref:accessory gene regulator ArgB-like protein n=1 Tax=unclassified Paenibacillus TaxID=185978 RepID=UPI00096EFDD2|nr:accessory gene regulator B family protein [Paenibacillus sp. FSL H8-0259]OMF31000.1 hypothetical protein BK132_06100 [Paenibacillus sp. FSL H8-0259]
MIDFLSLRIAQGIKKGAPDSTVSIAVMKYALSIIINASMIISLSLLFSIFTGKTVEVAIALVAFPLLRQVSGGYHMQSGLKCIVFSTILITAISLANFGYWTIVTLGIVSFILVALFAPSKIERQSRIPRKFYPFLKVVSLIIVSTNFLLVSSVLSATFFAQGISLIHMKGGDNK